MCFDRDGISRGRLTGGSQTHPFYPICPNYWFPGYITRRQYPHFNAEPKTNTPKFSDQIPQVIKIIRSLTNHSSSDKLLEKLKTF